MTQQCDKKLLKEYIQTTADYKVLQQAITEVSELMCVKKELLLDNKLFHYYLIDNKLESDFKKKVDQFLADTSKFQLINQS